MQEFSLITHLSHENNLPILAYQTSKGFFEASGISERDTRLAVAHRYERSPIFDVYQIIHGAVNGLRAVF